MKKRFKNTKRIIKAIIFLLLLLALGVGYLNIKYPIGYNSIVREYSAKYGIDPYLVASIINVESSYDKEAISPKDAKGLMQISPQTGEWASEEIPIENYSESRLFEPEVNIEIGCWYLDRLSDQFDGNLDHMLIAYNAGSGNLNKWLSNSEYSEDGINVTNIPFEETENYLVKVKEDYKVYNSIYKKYYNNISQSNTYIDIGNNIRKTIKEFIR